MVGSLSKRLGLPAAMISMLCFFPVPVCAADGVLCQASGDTTFYEEWTSPEAFETDFEDAASSTNEDARDSLNNSPYIEPYQPAIPSEPNERQASPEEAGRKEDADDAVQSGRFTDLFRDLLQDMGRDNISRQWEIEPFPMEDDSSDELFPDRGDSRELMETEHDREPPDFETIEHDRYDKWDQPLGAEPVEEEEPPEPRWDPFESFQNQWFVPLENGGSE